MRLACTRVPYPALARRIATDEADGLSRDDTWLGRTEHLVTPQRLWSLTVFVHVLLHSILNATCQAISNHVLSESCEAISDHLGHFQVTICARENTMLPDCSVEPRT